MQHDNKFRTNGGSYGPRGQQEGSRRGFNKDGKKNFENPQRRLHTSPRPADDTHSGRTTERGYHSSDNQRPYENRRGEHTSHRVRFSVAPQHRVADNAEETPHRYGNHKSYDAQSHKNYGTRPHYHSDNAVSEHKSVYSQKKQLEHRKNMINLDEPMRLNRYIANSGICSRREADQYIQAGVITVNGEVVTELGTKIIPIKDKVLFHDQLLRAERRIYVLLNKPKDCVTTMDDPHAKKTVMDIVKNACKERIYPVGRLDRNTTGVLLFTNDGELATALTHPKFNKKKIYQVTLDRPFTDEDMNTLLNGITLEDGDIKADDISFIKEDDHRQIGIEIHSGRNRIVRRMFDALGYKVKQLDRVMFAGLTKKNLSRGKWRYLSAKEVSMLKMGAFE